MQNQISAGPTEKAGHTTSALGQDWWEPCTYSRCLSVPPTVVMLAFVLSLLHLPTYRSWSSPTNKLLPVELLPPGLSLGPSLHQMIAQTLYGFCTQDCLHDVVNTVPGGWQALFPEFIGANSSHLHGNCTSEILSLQHSSPAVCSQRHRAPLFSCGFQ